jgi:hypothetical protein
LDLIRLDFIYYQPATRKKKNERKEEKEEKESLRTNPIKYLKENRET